MEAFVKSQIFYSPMVFLEKTLPKEGEIFVKVGDRVLPFNVLAHTYVSAVKKSISFPRGANVLVADGDEVSAGQILAKKSQLLGGSVFKSPISGTVSVLEEENRIEVSSYPERFNLVSGIEAKVVKLIPKLSVLLETSATLVQGVWAQGPEAVGEIFFFPGEGRILTTKDLGPENVGKILIHPGSISRSVLQKAKALGVTGLVCASVESYPEFDEDLPILVTEGFGQAQIPLRLWESFRRGGLRTAVISPPRRCLILPGYREEGVGLVPLTNISRRLKVGDHVQILTWPYFSEEAIVEKILGQETFESGLTADGVLVKRLKIEEKIVVPLANLLILE